MHVGLVWRAGPRCISAGIERCRANPWASGGSTAAAHAPPVPPELPSWQGVRVGGDARLCAMPPLEPGAGLRGAHGGAAHSCSVRAFPSPGLPAQNLPLPPHHRAATPRMTPLAPVLCPAHAEAGCSTAFPGRCTAQDPPCGCGARSGGAPRPGLAWRGLLPAHAPTPKTQNLTYGTGV